MEKEIMLVPPRHYFTVVNDLSEKHVVEEEKNGTVHRETKLIQK
jgi:hypothetical protein